MNTAKVIGITHPIIEGVETAEDFIAYTARVSNPSNQHNNETAPKLLKYLLNHKHFSPFEMVHVVMDITTTRDISHQIIRHRSFSFQEWSQRYADPTKDLGFVTREARLQDAKNRQNSIETDDNLLLEIWISEQQIVENRAKSAYKWAVENGIAKEQARAVLPEGLTVSRLYMNGTLRSWIHFIELRSGNGTQKEHMEVARECAKVIAEAFPMATDFINNN